MLGKNRKAVTSDLNRSLGFATLGGIIFTVKSSHQTMVPEKMFHFFRI